LDVTLVTQPASAATAQPASMPADEHYARNLIAGRWQFPAAPYDFEIRSPRDSTVVAVVPLSSRLDVARAVSAAQAAAPAWAADSAARHDLLARLVAESRRLAGPLAQVQATETGLPLPDSREAINALTGAAYTMISGLDLTSTGEHGPAATGHVLSWGLPWAEIACATLPHLAAGRTVVVKPSLRAPLSAVAFAHIATGLGFPPGVINVVQGTGVDVGAALAGAPGLAGLHVRASDRTLQQAARALTVTGARLYSLRAGGNVVIAGYGADADHVAAAVTGALRLHNAGGPLSLPLLAVQAEIAGQVLDAVLARLPECTPAPLPSEPMRKRALARLAALGSEGARILSGGTIPDDAEHRMGWLMPPAIVAAGAVSGGAGSRRRNTSAGESTGPVLTVATWRSPGELAGAFTHPRYADGIACVWGLDQSELAAARLPHSVILNETPPAIALGGGRLPAAWTGGLRIRHNTERPGR
jgi:acyl-CoA reductase-like NAD-dependent aldehyde dehydrogenase